MNSSGPSIKCMPNCWGNNVDAYIDDIVIYGNDLKDVICKLDEFLYDSGRRRVLPQAE